MKDKISAVHLLHKIELFSKTSGLEVNKSKSECLLLSFEMDVSGYDEHFLGIPTVENLKSLDIIMGKVNLSATIKTFIASLRKCQKY